MLNLAYHPWFAKLKRSKSINNLLTDLLIHQLFSQVLEGSKFAKLSLYMVTQQHSSIPQAPKIALLLNTSIQVFYTHLCNWNILSYYLCTTVLNHYTCLSESNSLYSANLVLLGWFIWCTSILHVRIMYVHL